MAHEREVGKSRQKLRWANGYSHGDRSVELQQGAAIDNRPSGLTWFGLTTRWEKITSSLFVFAVLFSLGGILLIGIAPQVMQYLAPYYEVLVKIPTWTYMVLMPIIVWTLYVKATGAIRLGVIVIWAVAVGGAAELVGTTTGIPFGHYVYTDWLGPKLFGHVPYFIPLSWFAMAFVSFDLAFGAAKHAWSRVALATLFMLAWDVSLDPAMSRAFPFWTYPGGGFFYGMPLSNWVGWFFVSLVIVLGFELIVGRGFRQHPAAAAFFAVNCIFPLGLSLLYGLYGAVVVGGVATAAVLIISRRRYADRLRVDERVLEP